MFTLAQQGDGAAVDDLVRRYQPRLQQWATGRLPGWARQLADMQDLVQDTLIRAFKRIERFEWRGNGAFHAYLRQTLLNRLREEIRRSGRRPPQDSLDEAHADEAPSPLEQAIGRQAIERYDRALDRLRPLEREAVVMRLELGCDFDEIAVALGKPNANAARSAVVRALRRLTEEMRDARS